MEEKLQALADKLGIVTRYTDSGLTTQTHFTDESTVKFFAEILGYKAETEADITRSLKSIEKRRWQSVLEPVYVVRQSNIVFDIVLPNTEVDSDFSLLLHNRQNLRDEDVSFVVTTLPETYTIGKKLYQKLSVEITSDVSIGYYDVAFSVADKTYKTMLAVAPEKCYQIEDFDKRKLWGYALQLYSLKSHRNWGIGDFTDLLNFVKICQHSGADIIGLNPVNVLNHCFPEEASPYSSVSRLFLNPIYIDVENVPEYQPEDKISVQQEITQLNLSETIEYGKVYPLKMKILEKLYQRMLKNKGRLKEFETFCKQKGAELENLVTFQCLYEDKYQDHWGGWKAWEKEFQSPNTATVKKYQKAQSERLGFFKFLQFEADRQLRAVSDYVKESDLKIGIYRDLPVGVGRDSAEVWSDEGLYLRKSGAGAPPDAFFPNGQGWNLGAFNPFELKARAYQPFIDIIRSAADGAGALRLDHVMSLMRLFVIPENKNLSGTYIMYNFEDMLNIVAIESHLNKCMIIGESIGNVPEGFVDKITSRNILSMSVLWAERWEDGWGDFKSPYQYPENVVASVGTHDMAPLKMWWFGYDIALSRQLNIIKTDEEMKNNYHKREADRWKLLKVLDENQVWPEDNQRHGNYIYGEGYPEGIEEAVHRLMAKSHAKIFLVQPEDIFQVQVLQNLPGVDRDKHPNWRRKLPICIEDMENSLNYHRNISAIKKER